MKRQRWKSMIGVIAILALVWVTACSNGNNGNGDNPKPVETTEPSDTPTSETAEETYDPFGAYEETVKYTTVRGTDQNPNFPAGESWEKNVWQDYVEKTLNVKGELLWLAPTDGEQYMSKLSLDIASNQLPDIFIVWGDLNLLKQMVEGDMIEDMTDVYEKYASDKVKQRYAVNPSAFQTVTFDGKIMAIPQLGEKAQPMMTWVREDWRKEMGLPEPNTLENIRTVAKAFADSGKIGLTAQENFNSSQFDLHNLDTVFWAKNAFAETWHQDADGKVKWGGIQPEIKDALAYFRDMYAEGSLDPEFGLKDGGQTTEDVSAGKVGMVFQAWYAPYYPLGNTIRNDRNADWKPYPLLNSEGKLAAGSIPAPTSYIVVRKGYEHPELALKLVNLSTEIEDRTIEELLPSYDLYKDAVFAAQQAAYINFAVGESDVIYTRASKYRDIIAGKADESLLSGKELGDRAAISYTMEHPWEDTLKNWDSLSEEERNTAVGNYIGYVAWNDGAGLAAEYEVEVVPTAFVGVTKTMSSKWEDLMTMQSQAYLQIILGSKPIEYFDTFVEEWKKQGGDTITAEVQAEVDLR